MPISTFILTEDVTNTIKKHYEDVEYLFRDVEIRKDRDNYISDMTLENILNEIQELRESLIKYCEAYQNMDDKDWERRYDHEVYIVDTIWSLSTNIGNFIFSNLDGVY